MDLRDQVHAERHPWETVRFNAVCEELAPYVPSKGTIMDFGAGDAWFARSFAERFAEHALTIDCIDIVGPTEDETVGRSRVRRMQRPDRVAPPYDVLCLLDVLEHLPSDIDVLRTLVQEHTRPGSTVMITVPAWPSLWSSHDAALGHYRRYTHQSISKLIRDAGLTLEAHGGWFYGPIAARLATVIRERLFGPAASDKPHSEWTWGPRMTRLVETVLTQDVRLSNLVAPKARVPGLSWWGRCRV